MNELKFKNGKFTINENEAVVESGLTVVSELVGEVSDQVLTTINKVEAVSANTSQFDCVDNPEYIEVKLDSEGKIIEGITVDGVVEHKLPNKFNEIVLGDDTNVESIKDIELALKERGFKSGGQTDWSECSYIQIPEPRCAYINISNIGSMPLTKTSDLHAYLEFCDMQGNYFKKKVILNAQGNSTMQFVKKILLLIFVMMIGLVKNSIYKNW